MKFERSYARLLKNCPYSREGLRFADEEARTGDWKFAPLPETAPVKAAQ